MRNVIIVRSNELNSIALSQHLNAAEGSLDHANLLVKVDCGVGNRLSSTLENESSEHTFLKRGIIFEVELSTDSLQERSDSVILLPKVLYREHLGEKLPCCLSRQLESLEAAHHEDHVLDERLLTTARDLSGRDDLLEDSCLVGILVEAMEEMHIPESRDAPVIEDQVARPLAQTCSDLLVSRHVAKKKTELQRTEESVQLK